MDKAFNYVSIEQARQMPGLRLILCAGVPGVWGEAVKAMFHVKGIEYTAVAMRPAHENPDLVAWTAQSSAPAIVTADDRVLTHWESFVWLAEELQPRPTLVPSIVEDRVRMFGLLREIAGTEGIGWLRRLQSLSVSGGPEAAKPLRVLADKYGYSEQAVNAATDSLANILKMLAEQLKRQRAAGSPYYIGKQLSALDLYSAIFMGVMVRPLPADKIPMSEPMRFGFTEATAGTENADDILFEHCEEIFAQYFPAGLSF